MNDFTKDELEFLAKATRYIRKQWIDFETPNLDEYDLEVKINSMIDNYCEHEYRANACINCLSYKCIKCRRFRSL